MEEQSVLLGKKLKSLIGLLKLQEGSGPLTQQPIRFFYSQHYTMFVNGAHELKHSFCPQIATDRKKLHKSLCLTYSS